MNDMKTFNVRKWLFNPFIYIGGSKALLFGWIAMILASFVSYFSLTHFDGALDIHFGFRGRYIFYVLEQLIAWISTTIPLYVLGILFSKSKIRFIDVAGNVALARAVTLPVALFGFFPIFPLDIESPAKLALATVPILAFAIWMITLLFNAFVVSTNIRGNKAIVCFIVGIIVAEILSKIAIYYLFKVL